MGQPTLIWYPRSLHDTIPNAGPHDEVDRKSREYSRIHNGRYWLVRAQLCTVTRSINSRDPTTRMGGLGWRELDQATLQIYRE